MERFEWADIPAGTFTMGSPVSEVGRKFEEYQHKVTLSAFKMSKYEITVAQYKAFVDATGYVTEAEQCLGNNVWINGQQEYIPGVSWKCGISGKPRPAAEYNHPVMFLRWTDAVAFANWMGCRLPTEAEWEYACRAGTTTPFNTGDNLTTEQANYNGNWPYNNNPKGIYRENTMPVGSFAPNAWGLYDMHGNVWEWCSDWREFYFTSPQTNPLGPERGMYRVLRGGSWYHYAQVCRSAFRFALEPFFSGYHFGFRVASSK